MNSIKAIFQNMSSWIQLLFLFFFAVVGLIAASFLMFFIAMFMSGSADIQSATFEAMKSLRFIYISQFLTQIALFLVPAVLCAYLFNNNTAKYLKINKAPGLKFTGASLALILVVQPVISFTGYYNSQMRLPESLSKLEEMMRSYEATAQAMMEQMLAGDSLSILLVNIFVIAIMAGISEEFIFRGALQQIFNRITSNYHVAVWITAFIFSFIHFQFYGFVPRMILGAVLGYIFVWSGNLWIPVIVHAVNNALSIFLFKMYYNTPQYEQIENVGVGDMWWLTLVSICLVLMIATYMQRDYVQRQFRESEF